MAKRAKNLTITTVWGEVLSFPVPHEVRNPHAVKQRLLGKLTGPLKPAESAFLNHMTDVILLAHKEHTGKGNVQ